MRAPARHGPPGIEPVFGEATGFALGISEPGDAIYIRGDTVWYEGVAEAARRFRPRLAILFAGSAKPRGRSHVTMDNNDAIETAHAFPNAKIVVIHNDGWAHFTESQADTVRAFARLGLASRLQTLERGRPEHGVSQASATPSKANSASHLDEAIRINPTSAVGYNNRGRAYQSLRDYDKALSDYSQAIQLDPHLLLPITIAATPMSNKENMTGR